MIIPALYHWSPIDRRDAIRRGGLQPYCPPTISTGDLIWPYLCLGSTPSAAWGLSGDMDWVTEIDDWDLWQVRLADGDEVRYRSDFGPVLKEIRVFNTIPPDRVWHVATRSTHVAEPSARS